MDEIRWDVVYTLDDWPEVTTTRARNAAQAAFNVALELADRGFGDRVRFTEAREHVSTANCDDRSART